MKQNKIMTNLKMTMDFDYLNYVTSTKIKKVNDKNVKPVSHLIMKISFLTLGNKKNCDNCHLS